MMAILRDFWFKLVLLLAFSRFMPGVHFHLGSVLCILRGGRHTGWLASHHPSMHIRRERVKLFKKRPLEYLPTIPSSIPILRDHMPLSYYSHIVLSAFFLFLCLSLPMKRKNQGPLLLFNLQLSNDSQAFLSPHNPFRGYHPLIAPCCCGQKSWHCLHHCHHV